MSITERSIERLPFRRFDWAVPIIIALLSLVVSGFVSYSHNDKETSNRVTAVEVQQKNDGRRLERIEDKVDKVLDALQHVR